MGKCITIARVCLPRMAAAIAAVLLSSAAGRGGSGAAEIADTVLTGGKIVTVDAQQSEHEAVAVRQGRVLAVGSDEQIALHIGDTTQVIPLAGRTVIPGIIETHCHAIGVANASLEQPYVELSSIAEVQQWIRTQAKQVPPGTWLRVPRADVTRLKERRHPTRDELDAACSTHPVVFVAVRKHVFNSRGFETIGIEDDATAIPGGRIIRDARGRPWMIAGAGAYLGHWLARPRHSWDETLAALRRVHRRYNEVGITSIFERASNIEGYRMYQALHGRDELSVRTTVTFRSQFQSGDDVIRYVEQLGLKAGDGDAWVKAGPLKITADGGIHWGNAYLRRPYDEPARRFYVVDEPGYRGDMRYTVDQMRDVFATASRLGWQMGVHVTGDAGVDDVLAAWEQAGEQTPLAGRRFTLIHAYFPTREATDKAARLGVCVDTQPYLYYKDSDAMAEVFGPRRAGRLIGVGDWVRAGIPVAINSDHMIGLDPNHAMNSFNPFLLMYIAVSRKNERGHVYGQQQRIGRYDALRAVTRWAAYLSFDEEQTGSLEAGNLADLAVLDRDLLTCPEEEIREIRVLLTMVDGKVVYRRK